MDREMQYKPGAIEHMQQPKGGRGLVTYEEQLLFNRNELNGKVVLDLGAGPEVKFARELKSSGINAKVISLSPDFSDSVYLEKAMNLASGEELVVGVGQNLPFADSIFDVVLVSHVDEHIDKETSFKFITEISRVLKSGGFAKYGPVLDFYPDLYNEILENEEVVTFLKANQTELKKEKIETMGRTKVKDESGNSFLVDSYTIGLYKG